MSSCWMARDWPDFRSNLARARWVPRPEHGQGLRPGRHLCFRQRVDRSTGIRSEVKGTACPGEHAPIIGKDLWDKAQSILCESPRVRACCSRAATPALLKGLLFGPTGRAMSPTHTHRGGKLYRYYVCQSALKGEISDADIRRVSAANIEAAVI